MNVVELFVVIGLLACGALGGRILGRCYGGLGWIVGFLVGCALWWLLCQALRTVVNVFTRRYPARPPCRRGKCSAGDYRFQGMNRDGCRLVCQCGDKYIRKGNRFMLVAEDGSARPYMERAGTFRPWQKEKPQPTEMTANAQDQDP